MAPNQAPELPVAEAGRAVQDWVSQTTEGSSGDEDLTDAYDMAAQSTSTAKLSVEANNHGVAGCSSELLRPERPSRTCSCPLIDPHATKRKKTKKKCWTKGGRIQNLPQTQTTICITWVACPRWFVEHVQILPFKDCHNLYHVNWIVLIKFVALTWV